MDTFKAVKKRFSSRNYQDKPVEEEKLKKVLNGVRMAPSAHNAQDWKMVVVKDEKKREKLAQAASQPFIKQAPIVIAAVSTNPEDVMSCNVPTYPVDVAIAVDHLSLVAASEGLSTCWIGAYDQKKVKDILKIPERNKVVVLMPLGYPADKPKAKTRKDFEELFSVDEF